MLSIRPSRWLAEREMFDNYHGEYHARLSADQWVVENNSSPRPWQYRMFSGLLFWIPEQCMIQLDKIWVDDTLYVARWNTFMSTMRNAWEKITTPVGDPLHSPPFISDHIRFTDNCASIRKRRILGHPKYRHGPLQQNRSSDCELCFYNFQPFLLHYLSYALFSTCTSRP